MLKRLPKPKKYYKYKLIFKKLKKKQTSTTFGENTHKIK